MVLYTHLQDHGFVSVSIIMAMKQHCMGGSWYALFTQGGVKVVATTTSKKWNIFLEIFLEASYIPRIVKVVATTCSKKWKVFLEIFLDVSYLSIYFCQ